MSNSEEYLDGLLRESISGKKRESEPESMPEGAVLPEETAFAEELSPMEEISSAEEKSPMEEIASAEKMSATDFLNEGSRESEDGFLHDFEEEFLSGEDMDAFVRQFERELEADEAKESARQSPGDELFFENLDGILNSAGEEEPDDNVMDDDVMVDTIGDMSEFASELPEETPETMEMPDADEEAEAPEETDIMDGFMVSEENQVDDEDADVQMDDDLMSLLQSEGEFSDLDEDVNIDDLMPTEAEMRGEPADDDDFGAIDDLDLDAMMSDGLDELAAETEEEPAEEETQKEKKPGLLKRLSLLLFGPDEEELTEAAKAKGNGAPVLPTSIEDLTDDNLALLQTLEGGGQTEEAAPKEPVVDEKALKKQAKKEKKEQKKKEKAAKKEQKKLEKANRPKKERKPKKPKEPDNTPPLPKVPVFLCFVMAGSLLALVVIGTNLFSYSNSLAEAQKSYELGNYESAFASLSGMEIKEADMEIYEKCRILANAAGEYSAYQSFFEYDYYDLALDSLIRAVGRCDKYEGEAELYGCSSQLAAIRAQALGALSGFGVSEEQALALYANDDRESYSIEIYEILASAGFGM